MMVATEQQRSERTNRTDPDHLAALEALREATIRITELEAQIEELEDDVRRLDREAQS